MFKKKRIKFLSLFSLVIILIMTSVSPSFADNSASQDSTIKVAYLNKYGVSRYEDVASYIQNSTETETIKILDEYVTYYYGENYTIVKIAGGILKYILGKMKKYL